MPKKEQTDLPEITDEMIAAGVFHLDCWSCDEEDCGGTYAEDKAAEVFLAMWRVSALSGGSP